MQPRPTGVLRAEPKTSAFTIGLPRVPLSDWRNMCDNAAEPRGLPVASLRGAALVFSSGPDGQGAGQSRPGSAL